MDNDGNQLMFYDLVFACLSGNATEDMQQQLIRILEDDAELREAYVDYLMAYTLLHRRSGVSVFVENMQDSALDKQLWESLAYEELTAPEIEVQPEKPEKELIRKVEYPRVNSNNRLNTWQIGSLIAAAAAMLFIVLFIHFAPPKGGIEVATLIDSIDAAWTDEMSSAQIGSRLVNGRHKLTLREGMVKLLFDNSAKVVIEAPAQFKLLSEDHVELVYGRLYSKVPREAVGFMVSTLSAEIVDLGTEFGVEVDYSGDTSVHVIKGKTSLAAGDKSKRLTIQVDAGNAKRVAADTEVVSEVPCDDNRFIRDIDSANNLIWRSEPSEWNGYINWTADSGNWSDGANWDIGSRPDGTRGIQLRNGNTSVCTLNSAETPNNSRFTVSNGQTFNIEAGGYMGCGWSRFGESIVNMTGNGTWLLNDEDIWIGYPDLGACTCIWTMYDRSKIVINQDQDDGAVLYISQDNATGTLKLVGSKVTVNCDQLYVGCPRNPGFSPHATLEYVMDAGGASTIHVGYRVWLSEGDATSHLVLSASESLPEKDIVLIENLSDEEGIRGDGAFDTLNGGPATEGTSISIAGNRYVLTYQYEANDDGCHNDIALVFQRDLP